MNTKKVVFLITTLVFIAFIFQNCGQSFVASESTSISSFCKTQPQAPSPFESSKVQISQKVFAAQQKLSTARQKLSVVVNTQCLNNLEESVEFLQTALVVPDSFSQSKTYAVALEVDVVPSISKLEEMVENTNCVIGLTENQNVQKSQTAPFSSPNDPQASQQRHLSFLNFNQSLLLQSQISREVIVAIVDTGIDFNHGDLTDQLWVDSDGTPGIDTADDNLNSVYDDDSQGHGTHVAGIVAAQTNNSYGVVGLSTGYVKIMAVKALDANGAGTSQAVFNGIQAAIARGADIINLSLETPGRNTLLETAITDAVNAGVVVIAATGNQSEEITSANLFAPAYIGPSLGGMISVASVDTRNSSLSWFSNYSSVYAEIAAPGSEDSSSNSAGILSTLPNNSWGRVTGTSQASPMVAASAAMLIGFLKTNNISYTPSAIESYIRTDGSIRSRNLQAYVNSGSIVNFGVLATNLATYYSTSNDPSFDGNEGTGNTCFVQ